MSTDREQSSIGLNTRAEDNLRFIRATMENATVFTGISGKGYVLIGITALAATALAAARESLSEWTQVWMAELVVAVSIAGSLTLVKSKQQGILSQKASLLKMLSAFVPAMSVGGLLTLAMYQQDLIEWLPGIWLSLYGAAVVTDSALLAAGFGGLHIAFGLHIWRHHGG